MNYTCLAVGAVAIGALGSWFLSARKWFKGPIPNLTDAEEKEIEALDKKLHA